MKDKDLNKPEKSLKTGEMVEVTVKHIKPGTVLYSPTYDQKGNQVHGEYIPFTENEIDALLAAGIETIYYTLPAQDSSNSSNSSGHCTLQDYIKNQVYKGPRMISSTTQGKAVGLMEKLVNMIKQDQTDEKLLQEAHNLFECVLKDMDNSKNHNIVNLLDIQAYDDYTYTHSLNVGVIGMIFAKHLNYDDEKIKDIGLGGFLHDVGKVKVPSELINKTGKLSAEEFATVQHHAKIGYNLIKKSETLSDFVKKIVLLHHEKHDGSGYPLKLEGDQIEEHVAIIAIADYYDALTTERSYKKAFTVSETYNLIMKKSDVYFRSEIVSLFLGEMGVFFKERDYYPIGSFVLLNTDEVAKVVYKDNETTSRPRIEIVRNDQGKILSKPVSVDLHLDGTRSIVRIIHNFTLDENINN
ncbi:MAG: phosphodiesterase [bacterium]|nr:MAG: phosphodiesterase [bacterium]